MIRCWWRDLALGRQRGRRDRSIAAVQSKHVEPALRLAARGVGRSVLEQLRSRYPKNWPSVAARTLRATAGPGEIEARLLRDVHPALKLMLARWDELFANRLGERERAWALELFATRHAWAHLEAISVRDVLRTLEVAELLLTALGAGEARGVRRLTARLTLKRDVRRTVAAAVAGAAATLLALLVALTWLGRDEAQALPSSLAGPWPGQWDSDLVFAANLTQRIPFDAGTLAVRGDVLLLRTRLAVTPAWRRRTVYSLALFPHSESFQSAEVTLKGPKQSKATGRRVFVTMPPSLRLRLIPGSTRLLDADGRELAHLPDPSGRFDVLIPGLDSGRIYYVESRLRAVAPSSEAKGQIESVPLECHGDGGRAAGPVTGRGNSVLCRVRLQNLGPQTLETMLVQLSDVIMGRTAVVTLAASADDAAPATTEFVGTPMLWRGLIRGVEYVPGSARLLTAFDELLGTFRGNPLQRPLVVGELRPGPTNARYFEFAIRLR